MAANKVQVGDVLTLLAPSGGVVTGVGYVIGSIFAVAETTAAEGASFAGAVEGVFEMPKATHASSKAFTAGEHVWWDNTNKRWDKTGSGLFQIGVVTEAVASTVAVCKVQINRRVLAAT